MIYDVEGKFYELGGAIIDGVEIQKLSFDNQRIEDGERYIKIPEGIVELHDSTFKEYNTGDIVRHISNILNKPQYNINEWEKRLKQNKIVKITFPQLANDSFREKAKYMHEMEKRVRLLKIDLPKSIKKIDADGFPYFLEEINVEEDNPFFTSLDGVLYSREMYELIKYPGYKSEEIFEIPNGVKKIKSKAFKNAFIKKIILPASVKIIEDYAFEGIAGLEELEIQNSELSIGIGTFRYSRIKNIQWWGWSEIPTATFMNSNISRIQIPEGVVCIGEYAFAGCGKSAFISIPDTVSEIGVNSFELGAWYEGKIVLPQRLLSDVLKFPPLSHINDRAMSKLLQQLSQEISSSKIDVIDKKSLEHYDKNLDNLIKKINFMQIPLRIECNRQKKYITAIKNNIIP